MPQLLPFQHPREIPPTFQNRIVTGTGHRPQKLGGYSEHARGFLIHLAIDWLTALQPRAIISGLAQGWDSALIEACWELGVSYVACAPFINQESKWPVAAQRRYDTYVERALRFIVCSPGDYDPKKMQIRNERMVKIALKDGPDNGLLLALWDGAPNGGTYNCINYAANQGLPIINAWANALSYQNDE